MDLTLELNKVPKKASIVFAGRKDFGFLDRWRKDLGDEENPRMKDAMLFAQLAIYRFEAHSAAQPYVKSIVDIGDHIASHPQVEVAGLMLMKCDWFPPSEVLGVCHFRRTWSNNIILDYLAAYPFIARAPTGYPHIVKGVGIAFLYFLSQLAKKFDCKAIWGEATPISWEYYQDQFKLEAVEDLIFTPRAKFLEFLERPEIKELEWKAGGAMPSPALAQIYAMEEKTPPFVGSKTAVFNPAQRLAYRFLDLPDHVQTDIARELGLMQSGDETQPLPEQFRFFFQRAAANGKLQNLWQAVEKHFADGEPNINPFPLQ